MARSQIYNEPGIAVNIDGVSGQDFANDFVYEFEMPDKMSEVIVGTDKASTSLYSDGTTKVKIGFKPTSPTNDQLLTLYKNQKKGNGKVFNVTIDTGVNTRLSMNRCSVETFGGIRGGGKTTTMREYTLNVEDFEPDASA